METTPSQQVNERSGRVLVLSAVALVAVVVAYFALGMPGMDHSGDAMGDMEDMENMEDTPELKALSPQMFSARVAEGGSFVVNVHVPAAETIEGTVEAIAFDEIVDSGRLPADKATPILLYCESGRMSETAGRALLRAGYTSVGHLAGGLEAWRRANLPLTSESLLAR